MSKELKAISLLHPDIFNGDDVDLDKFCASDDNIKKELLAIKEFCLYFLKSSAFFTRPIIEIADLLEAFYFAPEDIRSDANIILAAANSDPAFLSCVNADLVSLEVMMKVFEELENYRMHYADNYELDIFIHHIASYTEGSIAWKDKCLPQTILKIFNDPEKHASCTTMWVRVLDLAHQDLFDDLNSLRTLLTIFLAGSRGDYDSLDTSSNCFEFWDGMEWYYWSAYIRLPDLQSKLISSPHYSTNEIQVILKDIAAAIKAQKSDIFLYIMDDDDNLNHFLAFLLNE